MKPGVTLSMIVRNESANLQRCLASAAEYMDVIQIVDTGSTDDTVAVAKEFGAEVFEIEWPDAFDEARNYGFDRVKTQWTFWLDADEWLLPDSGSLIRQVIKLWEASAYFVTRFDYRRDGSHASVELIRLWRTHPAMRLEGMLHENFPASALDTVTALRPLLLAPIFIGHDGYLDELSPEKMERNISLLRKQLVERPYSFYHDAQLQFSYVGLGDPRGKEGFRRLADDVISNWPKHRHESMASMALCIALSDLSDEEISSESGERHIEMILQNYRFVPSAMWEAYKGLKRRGRNEEALNVLLELQRRGRSGEYERVNTFNPDLFPLVDQILENERAARN